MTTATLVFSQNHALTRKLELGENGLRVAIKECLAIAGLSTRCGSAALADTAVQAEHSAVVSNLLESGCRIIGTANMHELAFGVTGINQYLGTPINPKWPDRIPGGSSSGSAVITAQGACDFAVGTDTGGSVRMPAACCGVFGMKPTFNRISRLGAIPADTSLDCIGPITRSAAMMSKAMAAIDPGFRAQKLTNAPRIAAMSFEAQELDARVQASYQNCLDQVEYHDIVVDSMESAYKAALSIINREVFLAFGELAKASQDMGDDVRDRILAAGQVSDQQVGEAEAIRGLFSREIDAALSEADILILPTFPVVPPLLTQAQDMQSIVPLTRFLRPFNLSGHPAMTLPILTDDGLPAGLQIVAAKGCDEQLCATAEWLTATINSIQEH